VLLASDAWGGQEIHTLALTEVLARRGHSCIIIELGQAQIAQHRSRLAPGVEVLSFPGQTLGGPRLYRFIRRTGAEIGVLSKGWPGMGNLMLDLSCRLACRGSLVAIEHVPPPPRATKSSRRHLGGLVPGLGLWWYAAGLRLYVRSLFPRQIVAVSQTLARQLVTEYRFPASKVQASPSGVNPTRFAPDPVARAGVRAAWSVPPNAVVYGAVGSLTNFIKGHDVSVEAFHRLYRSNPGRELYCVLVGTGADTEALRAQAAATSCPDRFRFPGTTESPWEAHCGLDVFLMPSRFEGLGLALLEAMACGVCPVVMAEGGIQDVVTNPEIGWSTPPGDRDAFLRSMQEALDLGEAGRRALGLRARQHVVRNFDAEEQYGRLADLIERL
jgi:glycosyltransferase involved in cell wall biosynthesis